LQTDGYHVCHFFYGTGLDCGLCDRARRFRLLGETIRRLFCALSGISTYETEQAG